MNITFYLHDENDSDIVEAKLVWLKKHFRLVSAKDLYKFYYENISLTNTCHLTIDDGWISTYKIIFPLLKKYGIPASIFVSPRFCKEGKNFWYMDLPYCNKDLITNELIQRKIFSSEISNHPIELILKEIPIDLVYEIIEKYKSQSGIQKKVVGINELIEMDKSGLIEIGAHTITHPILSMENDERSFGEIKSSVIELENMLQHKIISFAYPNGLYGIDYSEREIEYVKSCGIKLAYSVTPGIISQDNNPLSIPRIGSFKRLYLGKLGIKLPSLQNQAGIRNSIRKYLLK